MSAYLNQCRGQGEAEPSTNPAASAATDVSCRCTI
ncbi:hypothetical protein FVER14953_07340 [Fusarium verticillioides]|nr:hypothetical protein FVER14953_07340 [Fusarium verticillioides]